MIKNILLVIGLTIGANAGQREIVAATILAEARGEGERGMYAVACVIQQRVIERKMTAEKVCVQRLQFSCNNKGVQYDLLKTKQADYALRLADSLEKLDRSFVGFANSYHTKAVSPSWSKFKSPEKVIGNHEFYKVK